MLVIFALAILLVLLFHVTSIITVHAAPLVVVPAVLFLVFLLLHLFALLFNVPLLLLLLVLLSVLLRLLFDVYIIILRLSFHRLLPARWKA